MGMTTDTLIETALAYLRAGDFDDDAPRRDDAFLGTLVVIAVSLERIANAIEDGR